MFSFESILLLKETLNKTAFPTLLMLVGLPLTGKDTLLSQLQPNEFSTVSRDAILEKLSVNKSYNLSYTQIDSKKVDKFFFSQLNLLAMNKCNCIVNATNLTKKRRRKILLRFVNYYKIIVLMPLIDFETFCERNLYREQTTGKKLSNSLYEQMLSVYEEVSEDEGIDKLIYL